MVRRTGYRLSRRAMSKTNRQGRLNALPCRSLMLGMRNVLGEPFVPVAPPVHGSAVVRFNCSPIRALSTRSFTRNKRAYRRKSGPLCARNSNPLVRFVSSDARIVGMSSAAGPPPRIVFLCQSLAIDAIAGIWEGLQARQGYWLLALNA